MSDNKHEHADAHAGLEPIVFPDSARQIKSRHWMTPARSLQLEIAKFASETGNGFLHPEVTYAPIPENAEIIFLEDFDLGEKFANDEQSWHPCVLCKHDLPQFKKGGVVSWLPELGWITIIGRDCFKKRNPEAYKEAAKQFTAAKRSRSNQDYLITRLPQIPILLDCIEQDLAIVSEFEKFRAHFFAAAIEYDMKPLLKYLSRGRLQLEARKRRIITHSTGSRTTKTDYIDHATFSGKEFFKENTKNISSKLTDVAEKLQIISIEIDEVEIKNLADDQKNRLANQFQAAAKAYHTARFDFEKIRAFISPVTGRTIAAWSLIPEKSYQVYFEYHHDYVELGYSRLACKRIEVLPLAHESLAILPELKVGRLH